MSVDCMHNIPRLLHLAGQCLQVAADRLEALLAKAEPLELLVVKETELLEPLQGEVVLKGAELLECLCRAHTEVNLDHVASSSPCISNYTPSGKICNQCTEPLAEQGP